MKGHKKLSKREVDPVLSSPIGQIDFSRVLSLGKLMTILLVKNLEGPSLRKLKHEIDFRDGNIRGSEGNVAVLGEPKPNPAGISATNANLAIGLII